MLESQFPGLLSGDRDLWDDPRKKTKGGETKGHQNGDNNDPRTIKMDPSHHPNNTVGK